jgi:hypothetical protein
MSWKIHHALVREAILRSLESADLLRIFPIEKALQRFETVSKANTSDPFASNASELRTSMSVFTINAHIDIRESTKEAKVIMTETMIIMGTMALQLVPGQIINLTFVPPSYHYAANTLNLISYGFAANSERYS